MAQLVQLQSAGDDLATLLQDSGTYNAEVVGAVIREESNPPKFEVVVESRTLQPVVDDLITAGVYELITIENSVSDYDWVITGQRSVGDSLAQFTIYCAVASAYESAVWFNTEELPDIVAAQEAAIDQGYVSLDAQGLYNGSTYDRDPMSVETTLSLTAAKYYIP